MKMVEHNRVYMDRSLHHRNNGKPVGNTYFIPDFMYVIYFHYDTIFSINNSPITKKYINEFEIT